MSDPKQWGKVDAVAERGAADGPDSGIDFAVWSDEFEFWLVSPLLV